MKYNGILLLMLAIVWLEMPISAQIVIKNGANIDMSDSPGSVIIFPDGSTLSTAGNLVVADSDGGNENTVSGENAFIGGGSKNTASGLGSTVGGGKNNTASGWDSTVGGGSLNDALEQNSTVGGGWANVASGSHSMIGGGRNNIASGTDSTVGGGYNNKASGVEQSTVGGGKFNTASGMESTVGGGNSNDSSGASSAVGGGSYNSAAATGSTVVGGDRNKALGAYSTVSGGQRNSVSGDFSWVGGEQGSVNARNSFVWSGNGLANSTTRDRSFQVYADEIRLNATVYHSGDREMREGFHAVRGREVLDKVIAMPISTWRFKSEEDDISHIGPVAQDFMASFGYGNSDKHIASSDADGVALAAIQGLHEMLEEKDTTAQAALRARHQGTDSAIKALLQRMEEKNAQIAALTARLEALESAK